jgi:hypothetical protein
VADPLGAHHRVGEPAAGFVDVDDHLARHESIGEVTIRSGPSITVSLTNRGARRVCTAATSAGKPTRTRFATKKTIRMPLQPSR